MTEQSTIELQLLRWGEGPTGRTVTFLLPSDAPQHPFKGLRTGPSNGQRLGAAFVLIHDNEQATPIEPPSTAPEKPKGGRLAQQAGIACGDPRFKAFLIEQQDLSVSPDAPISTAEVAEAVRILCHINSRSELDSNPDAAERWRDLYGQYIAWLTAP